MSKMHMQDFLQNSRLLQENLLALKSRIQNLQKPSSTHKKNDHSEIFHYWENWQQSFYEYRQSLKNMPKELQQKIHDAKPLAQLENFRIEFHNTIENLKHSPSFQNFQTQVHEKFKAMQTHIENLRDELSRFEKHPFVEKFLRGERVLSCKNQIQWGRKFGHAAFALFFIWLFKFSPFSLATIYSITGSIVLCCSALEIARHLSPKVNNWVWKYFRPVMRENEKHKVNSAMFYMFSMIFVYMIFPIDVCLVAFLFLGFGDTVAGIVGVKFGKHKLTKHASLEGFLAGFATCTIASFIAAKFLVDTPIDGFGLLAFSLLSGSIGAISEISFKKLDDNLVIPLMSSPFIWVFMKIFHIL